MDIEFLGTGGAVTIPRAGCHCSVCEEARAKGVPFKRSGPGLFIRDLSLLIDTSEDIGMQLNRAGIDRILYCLYSHWHPDHTMGCRIFEMMNADWHGRPRKPKYTDVFLPEQVAKDAEHYLGFADHLRYMERAGWIRTAVIDDGGRIEIGGMVVTPIRLAEDYAYAFLLEQRGKRIFIAADELHGYEPAPWLAGIDLAIVPSGIFEFHPLTHERLIEQEAPELKAEATFAETLTIIRKLHPERCYLTHIEEVDRLSHDELCRIAQYVSDMNPYLPPIRIAYDGLRVFV